MCVSCTTVNFDQARADAFAGTLLSHLNSAAVALMASIGHRTGLFDAMADGEPTDSRALAGRTGLSERYVREWLGAMTTGRIVIYDRDADRHHLPREHAAWLTRAAAPNNLGATFQWIGLLGAAEDKVVDAFTHGRGVPYSAYPRFGEVMAEESAKTTVMGLDQHIIPLVEGLERRLEQGIDVVDIGCGRGRAVLHLAGRFPNSRFVGVDFLQRDLDHAADEAHRRGLANVKFDSRDAALWTPERAYDLVMTFDAVHDQAKPQTVLWNIRRALRPGGVYLMQDIAASSNVANNLDHALAPFIYTISCMHCMSVSLASNGAGLGAAWGRELAVEMLGKAGFHDVSINKLPHDILNDYYVLRV